MRYSILLFIVLIMVLSSCSGKDTITEFSDPDIQILKLHDSDESSSELHSLFIISSQTTVDINVYDYIEDGGKIYSVGEKGYTVLNIKTKTFKQSTLLIDFISEERDILKKLKIKQK
ncbi:hypothetical protein D3C74_219450 [compost metagenome]